MKHFNASLKQTSVLPFRIWVYLPLAAPISSMLSGRIDKASIDSDT